MCDGREYMYGGEGRVGGLHGRQDMYGRGRVCMVGGGCAWLGACMAGVVCGEDMCCRGACMVWGCVFQERWPLKEAVCILLECIIVQSFDFRIELSLLMLYPDSGISMDEEIVLGDMIWSYNKAEL